MDHCIFSREIFAGKIRAGHEFRPFPSVSTQAQGGRVLFPGPINCTSLPINFTFLTHFLIVQTTDQLYYFTFTAVLTCLLSTWTRRTRLSRAGYETTLLHRSSRKNNKRRMRMGGGLGRRFEYQILCVGVCRRARARGFRVFAQFGVFAQLWVLAPKRAPISKPTRIIYLYFYVNLSLSLSLSLARALSLSLSIHI